MSGYYLGSNSKSTEHWCRLQVYPWYHIQHPNWQLLFASIVFWNFVFCWSSRVLLNHHHNCLFLKYKTNIMFCYQVWSPNLPLRFDTKWISNVYFYLLQHKYFCSAELETQNSCVPYHIHRYSLFLFLVSVKHRRHHILKFIWN